jgi:DNA-directed RNA polymerase subunit M/transcription elongation factor TFIIS
MVRRQKLISMTDRHFEVAQEMGNFSKWVREQLDEYIQQQEERTLHLRNYNCKKCGEEHLLSRVHTRLKGNHYPMFRWCKTCESNTLERVI